MPRKSPKNVGLIGLGIIGSRVAVGLRSEGFQVYVWNRTPKAAPNFLGSPAEVAEAADIIQIFVADSGALFSVIEAMGDALTPDHVVVCSSTVGPEAAIERDRFTETEHQFGGAGAEPAAPSRLSLLTCGHEVGMPLTSPAGKQGCLALANGLRLRRGSGLRQGGTTL